MEAECGNTNEHYNEKCVDNTVVSEIPNTTYSGTDTVSSYTHYVSHEHSSQILTNNELNSYTTQEYSLSYTENYPSDNVNNFNSNVDTKEIIENEIQKQPYEPVQQENIPMDTSDNTVSIDNQNVSNVYMSGYQVEEIQTEKVVEKLPEDTNIVIEEPAENTGEAVVNVEHSQQTSEQISVEEIEDSSLPSYETVDNSGTDNVVITEVDDDNNAQDNTVQTEETTADVMKDEGHLESAEIIKDEKRVQENVENTEQNLEDSTDIAEGKCYFCNDVS